MFKNQSSKKRNPWAWVPTLYFAEGVPYVAVMTISLIMYKRLGSSVPHWLVWASPFLDLGGCRARSASSG